MCDCGGVVADYLIEGVGEVVFHLLFLEYEMPAEGFAAVTAHIHGLFHHGCHQFVGLAVVEEDQQDGCYVTDVFVVKVLAFLFFEHVHQLSKY
jgi:hypothetical protein